MKENTNAPIYTLTGIVIHGRGIGKHVGTPTANIEIAKNTFLLYMRMVIVMVITIYTVRVVIDTLGLEDYGVYNVVAGVIILLNCLNRVLSSATQRFYSYSIGIFSISINIYIIISIIVIVWGKR